ncbi:ABC transporter ATP-binding protein [Corynebacterium sp. H130]|uniref:ABC transporter ATP-binding protein n=1 Tax=Corynebacterium sp. H130 TaxID=3133444 RepID=UPI0030AE3250
MSGAAVEARGFGWRHASRKKPALSDITFHIDPGEKVLILGESGAGKSTLLAAIAGVLGDEDEGDWSGSLTVAGRDSRACRGLVGMVLQDPDSQVIAARVGDDVAFGCENLGVDREETWRRVSEALELVGLDLPLDHPTSHLSGGQKQRLALAGIIAMGAQVIVLDEPTANLDPEGVREVTAAIEKVTARTGATLIVVEHRVDTWIDLVDRGIVISADGTLLHDAPISALLRVEASSLAAKGMWVPELSLPMEERIATPGLPNALGETILETHELRSGWDRPLGPPRNLSIPAAAGTVVTGPNGAGKTTLALTMAGLLSPCAGSVTLCGRKDPHTWSSSDLARHIGVVFQDPEHQFLTSTVLDEMLLSSRVRKRQRRRALLWTGLPEADGVAKQRAQDLLDRLGLAHLAAANPFTLSGGQKRRLSVATALIDTPDVLLLDEPTFGQDRRTFLDLTALLRDLTREGVAVVAITHDHHFVALLGDHHVEVTA